MDASHSPQPLAYKLSGLGLGVVGSSVRGFGVYGSGFGMLVGSSSLRARGLLYTGFYEFLSGLIRALVGCHEVL